MAGSLSGLDFACAAQDDRVWIHHRCRDLLPWAGTTVASGGGLLCHSSRGRAGCYCLCFTRRSVHHCLSRGIMESPPPQSGPPAIEMIDVAVASMRDQSLAAVENVNWRAEPRDYWAIAGLQGSGKSDFLMTTGGVMPPMRGVTGSSES